MAALISVIPGGPACNGFVITPTDGLTFATNTRGIYVGAAGNLAVVMAQDSAVVIFNAIPAGSLLPISCKQVLSTGTTAGNLVGVF